MNLEIRHLKLIKAVAEAGGVTRAASRLHLTQSALSHQLRDIESKLGAQFFLRLNKKMILTPAGERLLSSAEGVLSELKRAEEDIRQIATNREGIVRLSTECYTCYHWLPAALKPFNEAYPHVELRIVAEATRRPLEALLNGKLDLAITSTQVRNNNLIFKPLFQDELVVLVNPTHRLATKPFVTAEDFADEQLLAYSLPKEEMTLFQQVLLPANVTPRRVLHIDLTEAIIEMVKAGLGIGVMARWAIAPQLEAGTLKAVALTKKGLHRQWSAAMIKSKTVPAYLLKFIDLMAELPLLKARKQVRAKTTSR